MDRRSLKVVYCALGAVLVVESGLSLGFHFGTVAGVVGCAAAALAGSRTLYLGFVGCARPRATAAFTALRIASGAVAVACPVRAVSMAVGAATVLMIGSSIDRPLAFARRLPGWSATKGAATKPSNADIFTGPT